MLLRKSKMQSEKSCQRIRSILQSFPFPIRRRPSVGTAKSIRRVVIFVVSAVEKSINVG